MGTKKKFKFFEKDVATAIKLNFYCLIAKYFALLTRDHL